MAAYVDSSPEDERAGKALEALAAALGGHIVQFGTARTLPALSALALTVLAIACGNSFYSQSSNSPAASPTPTPGSGKLLYGGNYAAGTISEYQRSQTTGALTAAGNVPSGPAKGPVGLAIDPTGNFLYVANPADGLHQFKINSSSGVLTPLTSKDGLVKAGKQPEWVAISGSGSNTFAYSPNFGDGSISQYTVGSDGKLHSAGVANSPLLTNPFSAVATSSFLYVADGGNGTLVSFPINQDGTLAVASASSTDSSSQGTRHPHVVALDPNQKFLYASDKTTGYVSVFATTGGALSGFNQSAAPLTAGGAAGIAIASLSNGNEFLYVANQAANSVSLYSVSGAGELTPVTIAAKSLASPVGLVVGTGSSQSFLYVASSAGATVTRFAISNTTGLLGQPVVVGAGKGLQFLVIPAA